MSSTGNIFVTLDGLVLSLKHRVNDAYGVAFVLTEMPAGWYDLAPTTRAVTQLPYGDGGVLGDSYFSARPITLVGEIWAHDWDSLNAAMDRLRRAVPLNREASFTVTEANGTTLSSIVTAEGQNQVVQPIGAAHPNGGRFSLQLSAADPRKYGPFIETTVNAIS